MEAKKTELNMQIAYSQEISTAREINSNVKIRSMLANLENQEHQTQDAILEN